MTTPPAAPFPHPHTLHPKPPPQPHMPAPPHVPHHSHAGPPHAGPPPAPTHPPALPPRHHPGPPPWGYLSHGAGAHHAGPGPAGAPTLPPPPAPPPPPPPYGGGAPAPVGPPSLLPPYDGGFGSYYHVRIRQLEEDLDHARREIERLNARLAEVEKERAKETTKTQSRYWTQEEHMRFLEALGKYGPKDVRAIASYVGSRNPTQVRTHAQKYFLRVQRQAKGQSLRSSRKRSMSESDLTRVDSNKLATPPESPTRASAHPYYFNNSSNGSSSFASNPAAPFNPTAHISHHPQHPETMNDRPAAGRPPPVGRAAAAAPPPVAATTSTTTGVPKSCGINLLSIVASERKDAMARTADADGDTEMR